MALDETHDPSLTSWIESAQDPGTDFPIQNLPFGVFSLPGETEGRVGVAIGDRVLDVAACVRDGFLSTTGAHACLAGSLNGLMELGPEAVTELRRELSALLSTAAPRRVPGHCLWPMSACQLRVPAVIGDYTDFYASIHHASNVGRMLRPDHPLLPNYRYVPIGYHGRASSIVVSGTPVRRPSGQVLDESSGVPRLTCSSRLDYECEVGFYVGQPNPMGRPIPIAEAQRHLFGVCLVNDWSARDIQKWEYQPLGPFLSKSFSTSVSPWVVTIQALEPFRCPAGPHDPPPLPYLDSLEDRARGGIDLSLQVLLNGYAISQASFRDLFWTPAQLVAHHTSNGCNLRPGDLLASGTVSGPEPGMRGCLLELTWAGRDPLALPDGTVRRFLEDGDEVVIRGWCESPGFARIGLGECRGRILPAW